MQTRRKFIPVVLTPFKEDGSVDYDGLTRLTEFYLESGAGGLFANCLSSEMFELTPEERLQTVKHIIDITKGSVPVVATGTFKGAVTEQAAFIKELHNIGVEAAIVITSIMADENESDEVLNERIFELMDITPGIPLGFYECPVPYKRVLSAQQLAAFASTGRVIYHKDTSLDMNSIKAKLGAVEAENFGLYDAYMVHAVESLKAGSAGLSCIQGNFFPELIVWLCENFDNTALETEVNKVQLFFTENMDVMHDVYPAVAKYCLQQRGVPISTFTRRDVGQLTVEVKGKIDRLMKDYQRLQTEIGMKSMNVVQSL